MALRNLVATMRRPAAAALRLPPPRVSSPAGARPRSFYSSAQGKQSLIPVGVRFTWIVPDKTQHQAECRQHGKGINLESASEEEIRRHADFVGKEIDETLERLSLKREKVETYWQDIVGSVKLWVGSFAVLELVLYADKRRRPEKWLEP